MVEGSFAGLRPRERTALSLAASAFIAVAIPTSTAHAGQGEALLQPRWLPWLGVDCANDAQE